LSIYFLVHFAGLKIRASVCRRHHDLAVDDRRACIDMPSIGRDLFESVGPIIAPASEDRHRRVSQVHLDPVAVEFDFVNPPLVGWHLSIDDASAGSIKPGWIALTPPAGALCREYGTAHTKLSGKGSW
jgi:hypothetical protein